MNNTNLIENDSVEAQLLEQLEKAQMRIKNTSETISPKIDSFEAVLKSLEAETLALKDALDNSSDTIRLLEKSLIESKTNFIHTKTIFTENKSIVKNSEERHWENKFLKIQTYHTEEWWFVSWQPDEISKSYRLFLISEKREFCWSETCEKLIIFDSPITFKKPLIECKLEVRLKFSQYIIPFMNSFKEKLKEYRLSLSDELPSDSSRRSPRLQRSGERY